MPFEAFLTQNQTRPKRGRRITVALSLALHAGLATWAVVYSFWHVDVLSPPTVTVTFLTNTPPPPPPPPPPKKKTTAQTKPVTVKEIVQPKANEILQPKKPVEETKEDDGVEGGEEGGVAGGVVGGIAGGVAQAAPTAAPPPPPKPQDVAPKFLPPNIASQQLLTDPRTDPRYRVALPPALGSAGMRLWAMLKVCVSEQGDVSDVKVIKSMDATADPLLQAKIKTWRYKPVSIDGHAVRFCYNFRYEHVPQ